MIIAYHSIFSMYGFWLPNDPRGSGSDYIASWELFRYGSATKTDSRRSVAHLPIPPNWRARGQNGPAFPAGCRHRPAGTGDQPRIRHRRQRGPLPDLRLRDPPGARPPRHRRLPSAASARWSATSEAAPRTPCENNSCATTTGRCGENTAGTSTSSRSRRSERTIRYVDNNPLKEGKKRQEWSFVVSFAACEAVQIAIAAEAARAAHPPRRIGGAALKSHQEALRKRPH